MVSFLLQESSVGWDLQNFGREPTLAEKLYVLLVLVSIAVGVVQLVRNWTLLPPFRRLPSESSRRAALLFHRHALSLQRWMILNVLGWGAGTVAGLLELFRGTWSSRAVGMQFVAGGLEEVLAAVGTVLPDSDHSLPRALAHSLAGRAPRALRKSPGSGLAAHS